METIKEKKEDAEGIEGMLRHMSERYKEDTNKKGWLHPIGSEFVRPDVIKYLFTCADEDVKENDCVKKLSNIFYHDSENVCEKCKQNEKKIFEDVIFFAYRTLKKYKEQLNSRKYEKDNLTGNSTCTVIE